MDKTVTSWTRRLLPVVHDDATLLAVVKPAGIDTGASAGQPTWGVHEWLRENGETPARLIPINRLSRYESGILLFARTDGLARAIKDAWRSGGVTQEFVAVAKGEPKSRKILIDSSHGASRGKTRPNADNRSKRKAAPLGKKEATTVEVIKAAGDRVIIRCRTTVDNTHALRAQLRAAGLRLLGDRSPGQFQREPRYPETCLHLAKLILQHPDRKVKVTISSPPPPVFDGYLQKKPDWMRPVHAALVRRLPLLSRMDTTACRVLSGHVEDLRGVTIDRYGDVLYARSDRDRPDAGPQFRALAAWYRDWLDMRTFCWRREPRQSKPEQEFLSDAPDDTMLIGSPPPDEMVVQENGLKYLVRPGASTSSGLFLDQRDNRRRVRDLARNKELLNLFAYTCTFSIAATAGGARRTVNVDLSAKYLEWGRANFALNELSTDAHAFLAGHVAQYLKRAVRDKERFDILIIDPPSFAHGRKAGQDFSVERDLTELVASAAPLLRPGGKLLISVNLRRMSWRALRERVRAGLSGRKISEIEALPLPIDFAMDPDHAKSLLITIS